MENSNKYIHYSSRKIEDPVFQQPMQNKKFQNNVSYYPYMINNNIEQINIHTQRTQYQINSNVINNCNVPSGNVKSQNNMKCYPYEDVRNSQIGFLKSQRNEKHNINYLKTIDILNQNKIKKNKKKALIIDKNNMIPLVQRNSTVNHSGMCNIPNYTEHINCSESSNINNKNNNVAMYPGNNIIYHNNQQNNLNLNAVKNNQYMQSIQNNHSMMNQNCISNPQINCNNEYMQSLIQFGCFNVNCNFMGASRNGINNMDYYNKINGMLDCDNEKLIKQFDEDMKRINGK